MLKTIRGLILGLVVLVDSAYVSPTYASSAYVVISHVQAASVLGALDEVVVLYNQTPIPVDISGWCLVNKAGVEFFCFPGKDSHLTTTLEPYSHVGIASQLATIVRDTLYTPYLFTPTHASSGSLVGSNDKVVLYDAEGVIVDAMSWTSAAPSGQLRLRHYTDDQDMIRTYLDTDEETDWRVAVQVGLPESVVIESEAVESPEEETPPDDTDEPPIVLPPPLVLSELLPNPNGSDTGAEYIELFNASDRPVELSEYALQIGPNLEKYVRLPGSQLAPYAYAVVMNSDISFTLVNSTSRVALLYNQEILDETAYGIPLSGEAWARFDDGWRYTILPTPGAVNAFLQQEEPVEDDTDTSTGETSSLQPCAANQYRHPETNRCRLIQAATSTLTPCKEGQERNPETNRCRSVLAETTEPTPCKEGQERNPDTNRCRNIVAISEAPLPIQKTETVSQQQWYLWAAVGAIVAAGLAYAVWEWRVELREQLRRTFARARK